MAMAAATLSSVMWKADKLLGMLLDSPSLSSSTVEEALNDLKRILPRIQSATYAAEDLATTHDTVGSWSRKVKAAAYDAEDVLDDCEHELPLLLQRQATEQPVAGDSVASPTAETSPLRKISGILIRFEGIMAEQEALNLRGGDVGAMPPRSITPAPVLLLPDAIKPTAYGREDDREKIVELLLSSRQCHRNQPPIIPVVGDAGIGKTTLCWLVYTDPRICDHFEFRIWASVSQQCFAMESYRHSSFREINHLPYLFQWELVDKRFLLVMDDLDPEEDVESWDSIREQLISVGSRGSKVLMTSRTQEHLAQVMATESPIKHRLGYLSEESSWSLFREYAFRGRDHEVSPSLAAIGREIPRKYRGSPLALKMMGALLHSVEASEEQWQRILQSRFWDSKNGAHLAVPEFCFRRLPSHLKLCLTYCSLFPRGYPFTRDQLVRLWMAQDFVPPEEGKQMEDVGNDIVDELQRSLFLAHPPIGEHALVMPGLIHDLAKSHLEDGYFMQNDGGIRSISIDARHASLLPRDTCNKDIQLPSSCSRPLENGRTFLLVKRWGQDAGDELYLPAEGIFRLQIPGDFFLLLGHFLRSLDLSYSNVEELPESTGMLKHLRYLSLNHSHIRKLPESMANLHSLQTLELRACRRLFVLPGGISKLTKLRHLDVLKTSIGHYPLPDYGELTNLQTLTCLVVRRSRGRSSSTISQLKHLVKLRGELCIKGLGDILFAEDAQEAMLSNKEHLEKLTLEWYVVSPYYDSISYHDERKKVEAMDSDEGAVREVDTEEGGEMPEEEEERWIYDISSAFEEIETKDNAGRCLRKANMWFREEVFESLRPHPNLKHLVIEGYQGTRIPNWMGDPSFSRLVSLTLRSCYKCRSLPPGLGQLPSLKHLTIKVLGMSKHIRGGSPEPIIMKGFSSLECLEVEQMPWWEEWCGPEDVTCPGLRSLSIAYCPLLKRLPQCLPFLTKLEIKECERLTGFPTATSLSSLDMALGRRSNEKVKPWFSWLGGLTTLHSLTISGVSDLTCAPLQKLSELKRLVISCSQWDRQPPFLLGLHNLAALQCLEISSCRELRFLPDERLPSRLKVLHIAGCPSLRDWCLQRWSKLAHISRITFDGREYERVQDAET